MLTQTHNFYLLPFLCVCLCVCACVYPYSCLCALSSVLSGVCSLSTTKVQWAWWCFSLSFVPILSSVLISVPAVTGAFSPSFFLLLPRCSSPSPFGHFLQRSGSAGRFGCWRGRVLRRSAWFLSEKTHSSNVFCSIFFPPWFSLSPVESLVQALMPSLRQRFVDVICLPVSLPALSGVVTAKQKE